MTEIKSQLLQSCEYKTYYGTVPPELLKQLDEAVRNYNQKIKKQTKNSNKKNLERSLK